MRKYWISLFIVALSIFCFLGVGNVEAYSAINHKNIQDSVSKGNAAKLCEYYEKADGYKIEVYYYFKSNQSNTAASIWSLYYYTPGTFGGWDGGENDFSGDATKVFMTSNRIHFQQIGSRFTNPEADFYCTDYGFIDKDAFHELCFTDAMTCGSNAGTSFSHGPYQLREDGSTLFGVIKQYASNDVYQNSSFKNELKEGVKKGTNLTKELVIKYTKNFIKMKYKFGSTYVAPQFVDNYINNLFEHIKVDNSVFNDMEEENKKMMEKIEKEVKEEVQEQVEAGTLTEEQAQEVIQKVETVKETKFEDVVGIVPNGVVGKPSGCPECNSLLGPGITKIVNNIFTTIKFAGPVLVAVLTILDFVKAVSAGTQDEIKKASNRFGRRVIAAILLFFVPTICNLLFQFAGITLPEMCIGNEAIATKCVETNP